jgi:hypothetical protein
LLKIYGSFGVVFGESSARSSSSQHRLHLLQHNSIDNFPVRTSFFSMANRSYILVRRLETPIDDILCTIVYLVSQKRGLPEKMPIPCHTHTFSTTPYGYFRHTSHPFSFHDGKINPMARWGSRWWGKMLCKNLIRLITLLPHLKYPATSGSIGPAQRLERRQTSPNTLSSSVFCCARVLSEGVFLIASRFRECQQCESR